MSKIRIISDVHACYSEYLMVARESEYSVQIGDMAFSYGHMDFLDPAKHKFFAGNHDNCDVLRENPPKHYLGRFGSYELNGIKFFWVGDGKSVDRQYRTEHVSWWRDEELGFAEQKACEKLYLETKPDFVLSHDCPLQVLPFFITNDDKAGPSDTSMMLQCLFHQHQPKLQIFGHHHRNHRTQYENTKFICLNELCHVDVSLHNGEYVVSDTMGFPVNYSCKRNEYVFKSNN